MFAKVIASLDYRNTISYKISNYFQIITLVTLVATANAGLIGEPAYSSIAHGPALVSAPALSYGPAYIKAPIAAPAYVKAAPAIDYVVSTIFSFLHPQVARFKFFTPTP